MMSGYEYYKKQRDRSGYNGGPATGGTNTHRASNRLNNNNNSNNPSSSDYDPLLALTAAQQQQHHHHHQQMAMLTSLSNYQNLFAYAPPPPLDHLHHHHTHHSTTTSTNGTSRHDSFDDLAGLVLEPPIDWSSALPVPAPVVATVSAPPPLPPSLSFLLLPLDPLKEAWLDDLYISVKDIAVEPLTGTAVLARLRGKLNDVLTKYIPCVGFLVDCQQSLRKGLERRRITAPQYYRLYVDHLPGEFCRKNSLQMDSNTLTEAYNGLLQLRNEAANAQTQGSEAVKANFLGGMKDGESWGLRKWLSQHGGALHVCTDVECIVSVCRKLDKPTLERFSEILRPAGKTVLQKLKTEIPTSYQAHSTAHPYLPYFHRLEAALRNLSTLGEANEVICLDDDESDDDVQLIVQPAVVAAKPKAPAVAAPAPAARKRQRVQLFANDQDDDDSSDDNKPRARKSSKKQPAFIKQDEDDDDDGDYEHDQNDNDEDDESSSGESCGDAVEVIDNHLPWPFQPRVDGLARRLVSQVYQLAEAWESNQLLRPPHVHASQFWRGNHFAQALRLFAELLDMRNAALLAERTDDQACVKAGQPPFSHVIKHPIAFQCIVNSLLDRSGSLPDKSLASWNMFDGKDMLQAIDLVLLNSLAYGKHVNAGTDNRQDVTQLRKVLWTGIQRIGPKKTDQPTRRTEGSGFVVYRQLLR